MGVSTGPILAAGGITWANVSLFGNRQPDVYASSFRVLFGTGLAAGFLYGVERASPDLGKALAWSALITVLFVPVGRNPTPMERLFGTSSNKFNDKRARG
jgi:hypothetical protein